MSAYELNERYEIRHGSPELNSSNSFISYPTLKRRCG